VRIKSRTKTLLTASIVWASLCQTVLSDWTSFRAGGSSRVDGVLPVKWNPAEGIAWQRELPGYGQSTPVIFQGRAYVTAVEGTQKEQCMVLCFALSSGEELWRNAFKSANPSPSNYMASRAAPTPIVDDRGLYAFFETGDLVAIDPQGERLWHRDLSADYGKFDNNHGLGASPTHNASHLFLNIEHRGPSYLVAIDKVSGETTWKAARGSGSSWSSPIVAEIDGSEQVIVSSGGSVSGYNAKDGAQFWMLDGLEGNTVPSPTVVDSKLFIGARLPEFAAEGSVRSNCCIDLSEFNEKKPRILWRADKAVSDYCSPVQVGQFIYFVNKGGVLYCLDSQSGNMNYVKRMGTECWGTPIVADNVVYFFGKDGTTQVVKADKDFELVATNLLWDQSEPPKPEQYVEYAGGENSQGGGPGGGMMAALMSGDKNGDGVLQAEEISADFKPMLARIDTNQDGSLDADEIKAMSDSFSARRSDSRASARDPIVYGAAASAGVILIQMGTRLYCIQ
jgi:outer membrane protein assembly factor BamB